MTTRTTHSQTETLPLLSWRVWRSLRITPSYHPLADRLHFERRYTPVGWLWGGLTGVLLLLIFTLPGLFAFYVTLFPLMYFFANVTLNCAAWTANIAHTIAHQRSSETYDLLCMMPDGPVGLNWLICAEVLHHKSLLNRAHADTMMLVQVVGILPLIAIGALILVSGDHEARLAAIAWFALVTGIIVILIVDYAQSVVTACLVGTVAGNRFTAAREARVWAMLVTTMLQVGFYVLLAVMVAVTLFAYGQAQQISLLVGVLVPLVMIGVYVGLRELVNHVLLVLLTRQLNGDASEFNHHSFLMH